MIISTLWAAAKLPRILPIPSFCCYFGKLWLTEKVDFSLACTQPWEEVAELLSPVRRPSYSIPWEVSAFAPVTEGLRTLTVTCLWDEALFFLLHPDLLLILQHCNKLSCLLIQPSWWADKPQVLTQAEPSALRCTESLLYHERQTRLLNNTRCARRDFHSPKKTRDFQLWHSD